MDAVNAVRVVIRVIYSTIDRYGCNVSRQRKVLGSSVLDVARALASKPSVKTIYVRGWEARIGCEPWRSKSYRRGDDYTWEWHR